LLLKFHSITYTAVQSALYQKDIPILLILFAAMEKL